MVTRLVLRRDLRKKHNVPDADTVSGYWVQMGRVKQGAIFFWNGHWYEKLSGTVGALLGEDGKIHKGVGGWPRLVNLVGGIVPVFITTIDAWENPGYGHTPEAQNGPAPPKTL